LVHFVPAKEQVLAAQQWQAELRAEGDHIVLRLHADHLVRAAWVAFEGIDATLDDNAFDLLPGETRALIVRSTAALPALRAALRVQTLGDVLHPALPPQDTASPTRTR
jgi:beta-mannosidase